MLTVDAIAADLGIDPGTVRGWIASGQLAAVNVCKRPDGRKPRWRIRREDLDAFLASRSNRKPATVTPAPARRPKRHEGAKNWF